MLSWTTAQGQVIPIHDLTDAHLCRIIRILERQAQVELMKWTAEQSWWSAHEQDWDDERHVSEMAEAMHPLYRVLVDEAERRGLTWEE